MASHVARESNAAPTAEDSIAFAMIGGVGIFLLAWAVAGTPR